MSEKREEKRGVYLSWLQVVGVLVIFGGVLSVWNAYLLHGEEHVGVYYGSLLYGGYVLISVGVFVVIIGEFRKNW